MNRETLAAIDIGSNAIRLLINYTESGGKVSFKKAAFLRVPIRLGEDVFTLGKIGDVKREKMVLAIESFAAVMKTFNVKRYRACATSAMREAANGADVVAEVRERCGINIEIITGKEEAETIFEAGDIAGLMGGSRNYLYVDVGGGSTEVTIYNNNKRVVSESFPLGTVRSISNAVDKSEQQRFRNWLDTVALPYRPTAIIGTGGNINKAHKMLGKKDGESINYVEMRLLYEQLKSMSYEERVDNMGLNLYRADVIVPAIKIFTTVAKSCKINEFVVPRVGLSDGIIHQLYRQRK